MAVTATHLEPVRCLLHALTPLGYSVPGNLTIAAVDDEYPPGFLDIPLLRIPQQSHAMGVQSVELMLARMADPARPFEHRVVEPGPLIESDAAPVPPGRRRG